WWLGSNGKVRTGPAAISKERPMPWIVDASWLVRTRPNLSNTDAMDASKIATAKRSGIRDTTRCLLRSSRESGGPALSLFDLGPGCPAPLSRGHACAGTNGERELA